MNSTSDIVQRLWSLCHVLRDDGITYHEYVTELTYLLFLKMAAETGTEHQLPEGYRWPDLTSRDGTELMQFYRELLVYLGANGAQVVQQIFNGASTSLRQPRNLRKLVEDIDALDWYSAREEGLGDLYEGLLKKNADEKKSGAGQYFTPRVLIDVMVDLTQPRAGEVIQDPAAGTGGFLIAADRFIREHTSDYFELSEAQQQFQRSRAYHGVELVLDTHRLLLMNAFLHDVSANLVNGDSLSPLGADLPRADVVLTNPPFGTKKGGGRPTRDDFTFPTSNKQLAFLQHIYRGLKPGGRAAVVLPDNVLFEEHTGARIRADLMDKCDLHTILRLPTGIFYAQGVKTNVLFFTRGESDKSTTRATWVYDLRANMASFGKRTPLLREHFAEFEAAFGDDPYGRAERADQGEDGRFRCFTREAISQRGDNLDISWLRDESNGDGEELPEPEVIAAEILGHLRRAVDEMEGLVDSLDQTEEDSAGIP
jgi:type I restriction enzyme M protein